MKYIFTSLLLLFVSTFTFAECTQCHSVDSMTSYTVQGFDMNEISDFTLEPSPDLIRIPVSGIYKSTGIYAVESSFKAGDRIHAAFSKTIEIPDRAHVMNRKGRTSFVQRDGLRQFKKNLLSEIIS